MSRKRRRYLGAVGVVTVVALLWIEAARLRADESRDAAQMYIFYAPRMRARHAAELRLYADSTMRPSWRDYASSQLCLYTALDIRWLHEIEQGSFWYTGGDGDGPTTTALSRLAGFLQEDIDVIREALNEDLRACGVPEPVTAGSATAWFVHRFGMTPTRWLANLDDDALWERMNKGQEWKAYDEAINAHLSDTPHSGKNGTR